MKNLVVETGGNRTLNKIVQELLFASGYEWQIEGRLINHSDSSAYYAGSSGKLQYVHTSGWYKNNRPFLEYPSFYAATEMGKLIEFLEKKEVEISNVAFDGNKNHNGVISPDGKSIKVGCSTVTFEKVEEIYNAMQEIRNNQ